MKEVLVPKRRPYKFKTLLYIIGMSWGSLAYGYVYFRTHNILG